MDPMRYIMIILKSDCITISPIERQSTGDVPDLHTQIICVEYKKSTPISSIIESPWITKDLLQGGWDQTQVPLSALWAHGEDYDTHDAGCYGCYV